MRVVDVRLAANVSIRFRCDEADRRVVHALLIGVGISADVPPCLSSPSRHDYPWMLRRSVGIAGAHTDCEESRMFVRPSFASRSSRASRPKGASRFAGGLWSNPPSLGNVTSRSSVVGPNLVKGTLKLLYMADNGSVVPCTDATASTQGYQSRRLALSSNRKVMSTESEVWERGAGQGMEVATSGRARHGRPVESQPGRSRWPTGPGGPALMGWSRFADPARQTMVGQRQLAVVPT